MKQFRGVLLLTITALIWGTAFVAQSLGMDHLGPFAFNGVRNFIAALALLPVLLFMQRKAPKKTQTDEERKQSRKTLWVGGVLCGSALAVASNLQQFGISFTTVGKAGFLTGALHRDCADTRFVPQKARARNGLGERCYCGSGHVFVERAGGLHRRAGRPACHFVCAGLFRTYPHHRPLLTDGERRGAFVRAVFCLRHSLHGSGAVYGDIHACGHFKKRGAAAFHGPDVERRGIHAANLGAEGYPACGGVPYHEP